MGLLVHADPEPEVRGVHLELTLDLDDVRGDQEQPAGPVAVGAVRREELVLPEDLAGQEGQRSTGLEPGDA